MTKVNLSIPQDLLDSIDAEAKQLGISRSGLVQEASLRYIVRSSSDREAERKRLRAEHAARRMKEIGARVGLRESDVLDDIASVREEVDRRLDG